VLGYTLISSLVKGIIEPYGGYPAWANWVGGWGMLIVLIIIAVILGWIYNRKEVL
jgi:hypothetical protein